MPPYTPLTTPLKPAQRSPQSPAHRLIDLTAHDTPAPRSARQVLADDIAALTAGMSQDQISRVIQSLSVEKV